MEENLKQDQPTLRDTRRGPRIVGDSAECRTPPALPEPKGKGDSDALRKAHVRPGKSGHAAFIARRLAKPFRANVSLADAENGSRGRRFRLLIADTHELLVDLIRRAVVPEFEAVASVTDSARLIEVAQNTRPDIALIDVEMPFANGADPSIHLLRQVADIRIVCMDLDPSLANAARAFDGGAVAYVAKSRPTDELLDALRVVARGGMFLTPAVADGSVETMRALAAEKGRDPLSAREEEVLRLVVDGLTMKEVARCLDISPRTVAFHKYRGMQALGAKCNADLISIAMRPGSFWKRGR